MSTDKSNESVTTTTTTTTDLLKLNENNMKLINSPTKNTNSLSSRGELRRTNSTSTNKGRRIEDSEDVTKSTTPPPPASSSSPPLTQKHLYFNKVNSYPKFVLNYFCLFGGVRRSDGYGPAVDESDRKKKKFIRHYRRAHQTKAQTVGTNQI